MACVRDREQNLQTARRLIRSAAEGGARVILLPELFERQYFCQERRYEYYDFAEPVHENAAVRCCADLARELEAVIAVSFYERAGVRLFNSVAVLDADGEILGVTRKTHIPDDHYYQEKFYFSPGNSGFRVYQTRYGAIGVGVCWDQWFPETARALALGGAELLLFPTAIGSEPILGVDSREQWQICMRGHAACNLVPVIASNRVGLEEVEPCAENGFQKSALRFYGSSFMTDERGALVREAGRDGEEILLYAYDLDAIARQRLEWGLFRDRRPECYGDLTAP